MSNFIHNNDAELTGAALMLIGYVLRQIDLKRLKRGKEPLFEWFDLIKK